MNAKLILNGKEIKVELSEEQLESLLPQKKTGYERVAKGEVYYKIEGDTCSMFTERNSIIDDCHYYKKANYFTDETLAKNIIRANILMRQLRRFAVEHRASKLDWQNKDKKYYIVYDYTAEGIYADPAVALRAFGEIYFDSKEGALLAISRFKNELLWYFTEYKDSLEDSQQ